MVNPIVNICFGLCVNAVARICYIQSIKVVALHTIAALVTHHYEEACPGITHGTAQWKTDLWGMATLPKLVQREIGCLPNKFTFYNHYALGRENWQSFPELASCYKGAMVKYMIFWVAEFLKEKLRWSWYRKQAVWEHTVLGVCINFSTCRKRMAHG